MCVWERVPVGTCMWLSHVKGPCHVVCSYLILERCTSILRTMNIAQQMHYGIGLNMKGVCKRKGQPFWFMTHLRNRCVVDIEIKMCLCVHVCVPLTMPIKGDGIYPSVPQTNLLPVCPATVWQVETGTPPWCDYNICVSVITLVAQLYIYPCAPKSLLKCPEIMVLSVAAVAAACVVNHCGVNCQPLAAVCRASVDLKPVIASRHRAASYRETEYRSQIVFCHAVTQRGNM